MSQRPLRDGKDRSSETRQRLLDAAAEAFCDLGFREATVREICRRAGANVAAVNYHFGDKERLYASTIDHCVRRAHDRYPPYLGLTPSDPPEERLKAFVRSLLLRILDNNSASRHGRLLARELLDPTSALDEQMKTTIGPMMKQLEGALRELAGPGLPEPQLQFMAIQILTQCSAPHQYRAITDRLYPPRQIGTAEIEQLAEQITQFSLAGIRAVAAGASVASHSNGAAVAAR